MKINKGEEYIEKMFSEGNDEYKPVDDGHWISEGKYEHCERIFIDKNKKYWKAKAGRSGSHYTDWYYQFEPELIQVELREVIIKKWEEVA